MNLTLYFNLYCYTFGSFNNLELLVQVSSCLFIHFIIRFIIFDFIDIRNSLRMLKLNWEYFVKY